MEKLKQKLKTYIGKLILDYPEITLAQHLTIASDIEGYNSIEFVSDEELVLCLEKYFEQLEINDLLLKNRIDDDFYEEE